MYPTLPALFHHTVCLTDCNRRVREDETEPEVQSALRNNPSLLFCFRPMLATWCSKRQCHEPAGSFLGVGLLRIRGVESNYPRRPRMSRAPWIRYWPACQGKPAFAAYDLTHDSYSAAE